MKRPQQVRGYKVEAFTGGKWLWVIMPDFKTIEEAQAYVDRQDEPDKYRAVAA